MIYYIINKKILIIKIIAVIFLFLFIFISPTTSAAYKLKKGDTLYISVWGHNDLQKNITIGPDGFINFPLVYNIKAEGLTINKLKKIIEKKIKNYIIEPKININLLKFKMPQIMIMGEVKNPATYILQKNDRILDIISRAGGTIKTADMNKVCLKRNNKIKYLNLKHEFKKENKNKFTNSQNITVKNGDIIYIPSNLLKTTILGEVKKPGLYKLNKDAKISELIAQAGGLTEKANKTIIFIRNEKQKKININSLFNTKSNNNIILKNGDKLYIPVLNKQVSILGNIAKPGSYKWHKNYHLTELLAKAGNCTEKGDIKNIKIMNSSGKTNQLNLITYLQDGKKKSNPLLQPGDTVIIPELPRCLKVTILGEVKKPGHYPWEKGLSLTDLIAKSGNKTEEGNIRKIHLIREDGSRKTINLKNFLENKELTGNPLLQPGDIIVINKLNTINWPKFFSMVSGLNGLKNFLDLN